MNQSNQSAFILQWYEPVELYWLKRWLVCAMFLNLALLGAELLRENRLGSLMATFAVIALLATRLTLPDLNASWKRLLAAGLAAATVAAGLFSLVNSDLSLYDFWSRGWMIIPGLIAVYGLTRPAVTQWQAGMATEKIEQGLSRNKRLDPIFEAIGSHTLLIHAAMIVMIPVIWIVDVALSPGNVLGGAIGDAFTLEHFTRVLTMEAFWIWTKNSVIVSLGTTLLGLCLAIPAGYAFSRYDFSGKKETMFAFVLIQMFPGIIILVPYFMVMKTLGLLNTSIGLVIAYSVTALPLCVWMLKGFFDTVPRELEEAAMLDGCNQVQIFARIVLPLSLPAIAITALFSFMAAWNEFLLALVLNTSNDMFTLPVGLASMIPATGQRWGDFAAASILVSTPVVALFMLFQKSLVRGLSAGAVKG